MGLRLVYLLKGGRIGFWGFVLCLVGIVNLFIWGYLFSRLKWVRRIGFYVLEFVGLVCG